MEGWATALTDVPSRSGGAVVTTADGGTPAGVELTVDQLAAEVGMTVRNVRAYAARGLLPAPRLVGRTGYYGPEHVARLRLVRSMLGEGHTLETIARTLSGGRVGAAATALALHRALMEPWLPEEPEEIDRATLAARAGTTAAQEVFDDLEMMGVLEQHDGDRLRVLDPTLLNAGVQAIRLGVTPAALVAAQKQVLELVEQASDIYVEMFHATVWRDFLDAGAPESDWPRIQDVVEQIQPVAAQALLASFRTAMAAAVAQSLQSEMRGLGPET
jgi:DNA-binding transcriptional MerR regulator